MKSGVDCTRDPGQGEVELPGAQHGSKDCRTDLEQLDGQVRTVRAQDVCDVGLVDRADRRGVADADGPGKAGSHLSGPGEGGVCDLERVLALLEEDASGRGQTDLPRGALQQIDAQLPLEFAHRLGDALLLEVDELAGAGEAPLLGDGHEGPQLPQVRHSSPAVTQPPPMAVSHPVPSCGA